MRENKEHTEALNNKADYLSKYSMREVTVQWVGLVYQLYINHRYKTTGTYEEVMQYMDGVADTLFHTRNDSPVGEERINLTNYAKALSEILGVPVKVTDEGGASMNLYINGRLIVRYAKWYDLSSIIDGIVIGYRMQKGENK